MIGKIKGLLSEIDGTTGLIETQSGVFYKVFLPTSLLLVQTPVKVELYTYLQVREDALVLFGFENKHDHDLFILLLSVSGVGPKTAYTVSSNSKPDQLVQAVKENNIDYFTKIPGLGKKTAMKIVLELSQKMKEDFKFEKMNLSEDDNIVVDALVSLGFKSQDARNILTKIPKDLSVENKIKEGIKIATQRKK